VRPETRQRSARPWRSVLICAGAFALFACGSTPSPPSTDDASGDESPAGGDSSMESGPEESIDAMEETSGDDSADGGPDATLDSQADAAVLDAQLDTGANSEAGGDEVSDLDAADDGAVVETGPPFDGGPCYPFNLDAGCTPTEQLLLDKSPDCYQCLATAGCLDDNLQKDMNNECGDLAGTADGGAEAGAANSDLCLATLQCILRTGCAVTDVNICYCGGLGAGNQCSTALSGADGGCLPQEVNGLGLRATASPNTVLSSYFDLSLPSGKANQIFACAKINTCDTFCSF
jgi:hypothetical protein